MKRPPINSRKVVVISGSGISAPSGIATFRSTRGLWETHRVEDVASLAAWTRNPALVLDFYNERRSQCAGAKPNAAHLSIAALERSFEVVVITQNVDDLHERAGSTNVIHVHGELSKARSSLDPSLVYEIGAAPIRLGDRCAQGSQLRPHIVWFGEEVQRFDEARNHVREAGRVLVVGTSLSVFPAAGLLKHVRFAAEKVLIDLDPPGRPFGFRVLTGSAEHLVPDLLDQWNTTALTNTES